MPPVPPARRDKPTVEAKVTAWNMAFRQVLADMVDASGQKGNELVKLDLVNTAATVAASLVAGTDL
jgi:hypothetical protein